MTALTTRMMKIIAARRLVTDASLEPPSSDFARARMPAGEAVADWLSITATAGASSGCRDGLAAIVRSINESLRMGWVDGRHAPLSFRGMRSMSPEPITTGRCYGLAVAPAFAK